MAQRESWTDAELSLPADLALHELSPSPALIPYAPERTAIATTTLYTTGKDGGFSRDTLVRARLARDMVKHARERGYSVVIVDGGSDGGWRGVEEGLGAVLLDEDHHPLGMHFMGRSRRQALRAAGELRDIIAWTEPEKAPYILAADGTSPLAMSVVPVMEGRADLVVPRRIDNLASYPRQQQRTEIAGNLAVWRQLGAYAAAQHLDIAVPYLDLWIGSRTFNRDALEYFLGYDGSIDGSQHDRWESIFVPVWNMMLEKRMVRGVAVPYVHPATQTAIERDSPSYEAKRVEQFNSIVEALTRLCDAKKSS